MARTYRQLDLDERRTLFRLVEARRPVGEVAERLGRHRSTIYREIARNEFREVKQYRGYYPITAEDSARADAGDSASSSATRACAAMSSISSSSPGRPNRSPAA